MKSQQSLPLVMRMSFIICSIFTFLAVCFTQSAHASAPSWAFIRVVHASPDVGTVDVFMDSVKLLSSFQYATATSYTPVVAGSHTLQVALIGKGVHAAVITQTLNVNAGVAYTVAAIGTKATNLSLAIFTDDNTVADNEAKLRFYHLSPNIAMANVTTDHGINFQGIAYQQASSYTYVTPDTKALKVTVTPGDVTIPVSTSLKPWTVTSIFAIGVLNGSPKLQFVLAQENGIPNMPRTGSDPTPVPQHSSSQQIIWLLVLLASVTLMLGRSIYRRIIVH